MTFHRNAPAGPDRAQDETASADVREIYPGARQAPPVQVFPRPARRQRKLRHSEAGMATAEYAIATLAAVGFAGLLVLIMRSDEVRGFLLNIIRTALALP
ncbi:DUF4244 domain-containing protein [Pseudarthrobacter sp. B907]|uniref:DUF4244 domain-containing protein n=1 Tax=Pseudarthrobacter sp. B907 TaxID=3158261 RepID=UPI0032DA9DAC